jgi:hypothetical protein
MLALLAESALRSLALGGAVWLGLRLLRVRNPHVQMTAWTAVLIASLAMPLLMRWVTVTIPAVPSAQVLDIIWPAPASPLEAMPAAPGPARMPVSPPPAATPGVADPPAAAFAAVDWRLVATGVYALVSGVLLLRLLIGIALTWRMARAARPLRAAWAAGKDVRVSDVVGVPVTFGSTILLPPEYVNWSPAKRRAVLTHEGAHVAHADFYVLLLAALNRAVFWFNPFAWWQLVRLAELAEIISDDAAVEVLEDRPSYADILLDIARRVQRAPAGLAMARPCTMRQRVERILATSALPARPGWRKRLLVTTALVPVVALCAGTIARGTPPAPPERVAVAPAETPVEPGNPAAGASRLDAYVGYYQVGARSVLTITRDGDQLLAQLTGQSKLPLARVGDGEYAHASIPVRVSFVADGERPATALVLRLDGRERRSMRVDEARARAVEDMFVRQIAAAPDRFKDQAPAPGSKAALLRVIADLQRGDPNYDRMGAELADALRPQAAGLQAMLTALGPVEAAFFRGVGPGGYDIYGVQFANGSAEFRLQLGAEGTTEGLIFRPNGDDTPGDVVACGQEPALKPAQGSAPIRLVFFNATGADIKLFGLDAEGKRTPQGTIGEDRTQQVLTYVGRPWVVADAAGQCLEIVLPGQRTRFHTVRLAEAGDAGRPAPARRAPRASSEELLRRHIEALGRGQPDYARMTAEAAAETRRMLLLNQAIVAKLGPVRAMSFRGVTPLDNDVYMVQFANGSAEWRIGLAKEGKIARILLGPQY